MPCYSHGVSAEGPLQPSAYLLAQRELADKAREAAKAVELARVASAQERARAVRAERSAAESERSQLREKHEKAREQWRVGPQKPAVRVRAEVDDLLMSELGPSVLALVELRDNPKLARPEVRLKAAQELIARVLGPVQGPQVTVNVDSSLMALARRLDSEGLEAVRARARGELPPGAGSPGA